MKLQGIQHSRRSLLWEDLIEPATKTERVEKGRRRTRLDVSKAVERIGRPRLKNRRQPCGKFAICGYFFFRAGDGHTIGAKLINNSYRRSVAIRAMANVRRANCGRFFFLFISLFLSLILSQPRFSMTCCPRSVTS